MPPPAAPLPESLLFAAGEARLAGLDALPRPLWLGTLINAEGRVEPRLAALQGLSAALVAGRLPGAPVWPDAALAEALRVTLRRLNLPAYCEDKPDLTQQLVSSLLWHLDHAVDYQDRGQPRAAAVARVLDDFAADWDERCGVVDALTEVFGDLGDWPKEAQWSELAGLLKCAAWQDVVRAHRLIETLPELARLIRGLGRSRPSALPAESAVATHLLSEPALVPVNAPRPVRVPDLPGETRGVCRSGRVARMLPAEAMLLAHPRLRLVWHARHAERALLTYEDDDRHDLVSHDTTLAALPRTRRVPEVRREQGPMLICIDTSASMQGGAEAVAKACALAAARAAHVQGRACHLFAFGGPGEVVEMSLTLDVAGIRALTGFLGQSFRGGTDICGPIERAIERLGEAQWQLADLVIASDGDFGATRAVAGALQALKDTLGVRVQGVLIGDRETIGLLELADDVFWVRDWRRYGRPDQVAAPSPVHSKSLTADYFPGALRHGAPPKSAAGAAVATALWAGKPPPTPESGN